jgi:SAM-dependent methyltransferase/4-amino-4-deoxy-L-arabinose transferase-like glycosyltransferase
MMVSNPHPDSQHQDDLLWQHLKSVPAFRAVLRAVEARFYRRLAVCGDVQEPVLDIGCGDGHFAQLAFDAPLTAGIDPWWGPLRKARRAGAHRLVIQGMGDRMPFADEQFATAISNSVLEHILDVQAVLHDANRVLKPGGKLIFTTPSHYFSRYLAGAAFFEKLGLSSVAGRYRRFFNFISRHEHTDPPELWLNRLSQAGFVVEQWHYYFSKEALRALEWGHVQGLPSAVMHFLTGHWVLAPWQSSLRRTERWLRPFYEEGAQSEGAYLLFVARKVDRRPVQAWLPAATGAEAAMAGAWQAGREEPQPVDHLPGPSDRRPQDAAGRSQLATSGPPSPLISLALLGLALLWAILGQTILSSRPAEPWGGLWWYGAGLATLLLLTMYAARPNWMAQARSRHRPFAARRWLLPLALLLALVAYRQVSGPLVTPRPWPALLLWLLGCATAVYSLSHSSWREQLDSQLSRLRRQPAALLAVPLLLFTAALALRLVALSSHPAMLNGSEANIGLDALAVVRGQISSPFRTGWLTNPTLPLYLLAGPLKWLGATVPAIRLPSAVAGALSVVAIYLVGGRLWSREVGLVAAFFLAASHWHLHYSRLGMTNVWDPLLVLLALGTLALAWERGTAVRDAELPGVRPWWLLAGLFTGLNAYFYTSSHLIPLFMAGVVFWWLLFDRAGLRRQASHILAATAVALVVALPQILYYREMPGAFMERARTIGILHNGWLAREAVARAAGIHEILAEQWWQAALAFNYTVDQSSAYNPGVPLLSFWPSVFFIVGVALAAARLRQLRYAILLVWLLVTVTFAGALLESPPHSYRLLVAVPAVILLAAVAFVWLLHQLAAYVQLRREHLLPLLLVLAILATMGDPLFYFGRYRQEYRFGDANTEIAYEVSRYLNSLPGEWTVYFHGAPHMYADFPTLAFLAPAYQPGVNLFNVEPDESPPPAAGQRLFLYVPERGQEAEQVQLNVAGGQLRVFRGRHANPLFYAYEMR